MVHLLSLLSLAVAAEDVQLPVQGALADAAGAPLSGTHTLTFRLLDASGGVLWTETTPAALADGAFSVALGAVTPLSSAHFATSDARALTVSVDGGTPSSPAPVAWSPRAAWAADAGSLGGYAADSYHRAGEALQLGDTGASCDGATLGLMRWNGSDVEVCTLGGWEDVGSGPALAALDTRVTALEAALADLGADVGALAGSVADHDTALVGLSSALTGLSSTVTGQGSALTALEGTVTGQGTTLGALSGTVTGLSNTVTSQGATLSTLQGTVTGLQTQVSNLTVGVACPRGAYLSGITNGVASCTPEKNGFVEFAAGVWSTCARMADETVSCWGHGASNALGNRHTATQTRPVTVVRADGTPLTSVIDMDLGWENGCAIVRSSAGATSGPVWCWGPGGNGQLGDGTAVTKNYAVQVAGISNAVQIQSGYLHNCARLTTGQLKCWGYNVHGQLGFNGSTANQTSPVDVYVQGVIQSDWIDVSLGSHHTCGVRSNGTAWCWGWNGHGHLGDGTGTNRPLGVQVSGMTSGVTDIEAAVSHQGDGNWYDFTCATRNGEVWCWGRNANGQLGDGTTTQRSLPVQVQVDNNDDGTGDGVLTGVTQLSTGSIKSCAIAGANNTAYCWGYNGFYSVAVAPNTNRTRAVPVRAPDGNGALTGVRDIMVSEYEASSTYFILQPGTQAYGEGFAMGDNRYGQLGDGTTTNTTGWATPIYQR